MTQMPPAYDPEAVEGPVFERWTAGRYFEQPVSEGEPFTIAIPPPNVTGSLHMGHALNNTIQDVVTRRSRMTGRPSRWVVGTDHAGIATQNKVEQKLAKEGLSRHDVGRERFIELCWEWRREHGSIIIEQLKRMGCSCDYSDEHFTMDPGYQKAVRRVAASGANAACKSATRRMAVCCSCSLMAPRRRLPSSMTLRFP
jgi:valyl-tRNA synthetase